MQSQERNNNNELLNKNTDNYAQIHSTNDGNYKLRDTNQYSTSNVYLTNNNDNNSIDSASTQGSVTGDIIR